MFLFNKNRTDWHQLINLTQGENPGGFLLRLQIHVEMTGFQVKKHEFLR